MDGAGQLSIRGQLRLHRRRRDRLLWSVSSIYIRLLDYVGLDRRNTGCATLVLFVLLIDAERELGDGFTRDSAVAEAGATVTDDPHENDQPLEESYRAPKLLSARCDWCDLQ